ncbi:hypothetical protein Scep_018863 [Stephania cephalantha]|uniref:Uncharacterized protein n=1 Tax=Stephania cephalantha TaxID=152367 RepID=A0AAP0I9T9_9MAGN
MVTVGSRGSAKRGDGGGAAADCRCCEVRTPSIRRRDRRRKRPCRDQLSVTRPAHPSLHSAVRHRVTHHAFERATLSLRVSSIARVVVFGLAAHCACEIAVILRIIILGPSSALPRSDQCPAATTCRRAASSPSPSPSAR